MAADRVVAAVDLGGTTMQSALVRADGSWTNAEQHGTPADRGAGAVLEALLELAGGLAEQAVARGLPCHAVGVAVPGLVDEEAGVARYAVNLGWREVPVARLLSERTGLPVAVAHDVRAAAQAEHLYGAGRGRRDWLFLALGTGIAGAMVLGGEAYGGAHWRGGEIGHAPVDPAGPPCPCGGHGHLEAIASAGALTRLHRERTGEAISAAELVRRAADGDAVAAALWGDAVAALARAIATCVALLDPELVLLGGGLAGAGERLLTPLRQAVAAQLPFTVAPPITTGALGRRAAVVGAGARAHALLGADALSGPP
jgi:glucokinase